MSRIIKFRAWSRIDSQMFTTEDFGDIYMGLNNDGTMEFIECESGRALDADFMQFTGLVDKNGVEIYEGDILALLGEESMLGNPTVESGMITVVSFIDGCFVAPGSMMTLRSVAHSRTVIGNIHENPELMEGGDLS